MIPSAEVDHSIRVGELELGATPQHHHPFLFHLAHPGTLWTGSLVGGDQEQLPVVAFMQHVFDLFSGWGKFRVEQVAGVVVQGVWLAPASADVVAPAMCKTNNLIVVGTGGKLIPAFRIGLDALNELLQLRHFVEKTNKVLFRHPDSTSFAHP